jgi:hypothetical protein
MEDIISCARFKILKDRFIITYTICAHLIKGSSEKISERKLHFDEMSFNILL